MKVGRLIKLVEQEKIRLNSALGERINQLQDEIDATRARLHFAQVPVAFPVSLLEAISIADFRKALKAYLCDTSVEEAAKFSHLFVKEIKVYQDESTITGENLAVLESALSHLRRTTPSVPTFIHNWRKV